jgi:3-dehydroquinate synthase
VVYELFRERFDRYIKVQQRYLFDAIEAAKTLKSVEKIYRFFQQNKVNRSSRIWGIGGGITTDITAFSASTYMRGCRLQLVPTTFLAMIDSAIGGKTAVNFQGIKNNLGTFFPAEKVFVYTSFLKTLPAQEIMNGWAEAVKISLVSENDIYAEIMNSDKEISISVIEKCIDLKFQFCSRDPEDKNVRRVLNLGHTFGHILEKLTDYSTPHGTAVALGIRAAAKLSLKESLITPQEEKMISAILDHFNFPDKVAIPETVLTLDKFEDILQKDKKTSYQKTKLQPNLIIFQGFQKTFQKSFPLAKIYKAILEVIKLS